MAIFGLLLSLSLALLGLIGNYLVGKLNASYQNIVNCQLPSITIMREISQTNAQGRRLLDSLGPSSSLAEIQDVEARLQIHRDENSARLAKLELLMNSDEGRNLTNELLDVRRAYRSEIDRYLLELKNGMSAQTRSSWAQRMLVADNSYTIAQDKLVDYCMKSASAVNAELSERVGRLNSYFFLIAVWPFVLAAAFFVFGLLSTLVLFYRAHR